MHHAQAQNCVEMIFGVFKKRFPFQYSANECLYDTQVKLLIALGTLHNFITSRNGRKQSELGQHLAEDNKV